MKYIDEQIENAIDEKLCFACVNTAVSPLMPPCNKCYGTKKKINFSPDCIETIRENITV